MLIVGFGLLSLVQGIMVWVAVIFAGITRDGYMATMMTLIIELRGVGPAFARDGHRSDHGDFSHWLCRRSSGWERTGSSWSWRAFSVLGGAGSGGLCCADGGARGARNCSSKLIVNGGYQFLVFRFG